MFVNKFKYHWLHIGNHSNFLGVQMPTMRQLEAMTEQELRLQWYREAVKLAKRRDYNPSRTMTDIDNIFDEQEKPAMCWTRNQEKAVDMDITAFEPDVREQIIQHFIKLSTPRLKWIPSSDKKFLTIKSSMPDGSGCGRSMWTEFFPYLEKFITG